jgi:hypothetical protein
MGKVTKMAPGGEDASKQNTQISNVYVAGSGVGATNTSVRRSKMLRATRCCNKANSINYDRQFVNSFTILQPK